MISALYSGVYQRPALPLGDDGAGEDGVDTDVVRAELMGQSARESDDGGLGGGIEWDARGGDHPGDGTHVDDGAATGGAHCGDDGLDSEELRAKIGGDRGIEEGGGDILDGVALVIGSVVNEDVYGAKGVDGLSNGGLKGGHVGQIAMEIERGPGSPRRRARL